MTIRQRPALRIVSEERREETRPELLAEEQVEGARALLSRDLSKAARWAWPDLDALLGPMLASDLVVAGALTGNGKSTLLMSQMDAFATARVPTLYVPLEVDPEVCRLRWAAWKCEFDQRAVVRQDWSALPEGAREAIDCALEDQTANPYMHFATPRRMNWAVLVKWCRWATERAGVRVIMIDHFHRLNFGQGATYRVDVTEAARQLKDLARELGIVMLVAAQLNRSSDRVDRFTPPSLDRLKESSGIGEEADVVIMLSRELRRQLPKGWEKDLRLGHLSEREIVEPNRMVITCRKHRLDDAALNHSVKLHVANGKLESLYRRYGGQ